MPKAQPRSGELITKNYGWTKPTVGASDDIWGGQINANLDGIDNVVHGIDTRVAAIPPPYVLSPASTTALGGVKVDGTSIKAAGDGTISTILVPMGDNRIINGNFAINRRTYVTNTALAAAAYGHDRWKAGEAGCTYTFTATVPDTTITITVGTLTQIIEGGVIEGGVYTLSWTGTALARVWQGTATGSYAASPLTTASLTAGTNTVVEFSIGTVTGVKLEIGSVATPFNRQSLAKSMADCQRYYQTFVGLQSHGYGTGGPVTTTSFIFPAMRAAPSATPSAQAYNNASALNIAPQGPANMETYMTATSTGFINCTYNLALAAEL